MNLGHEQTFKRQLNEPIDGEEKISLAVCVTELYFKVKRIL